MLKNSKNKSKDPKALEHSIWNMMESAQIKEDGLKQKDHVFIKKNKPYTDLSNY